MREMHFVSDPGVLVTWVQVRGVMILFWEGTAGRKGDSQRTLGPGSTMLSWLNWSVKVGVFYAAFEPSSGLEILTLAHRLGALGSARIAARSGSVKVALVSFHRKEISKRMMTTTTEQLQELRNRAGEEGAAPSREGTCTRGAFPTLDVVHCVGNQVEGGALLFLTITINQCLT